MDYKHIYVLNKFEKNVYLKSQILNMLSLKKNTLVIFIKNKNTEDGYIHDLMSSYSQDYNIVDSKFDMLKIINSISQKKLIHARDYKIIAFLGLTKFLLKRSDFLLYDVRGISYEEAIYFNTKISTKFRAKVKEYFIYYSMKKADAYSFVTNNLKDTLIERYNINSVKPKVVIPTCVTKSNIENGITTLDDSVIRIVYAGGTARKWQRIDEVINSMHKLSEMNKNVECIFCVDNVELINEKIKNLNMKVTVKNLPNNEVIDLLMTTDYGMILRDSNLVNFVAAPTKLSEYLTTNNKVIYTGDIGSIFDLKSLDSSNEVFIKLEDLLNGKEKLLKNKNENKVSNSINSYFYWENNIKKYDELMDQLMSSRK